MAPDKHQGRDCWNLGFGASLDVGVWSLMFVLLPVCVVKCQSNPYPCGALRIKVAQFGLGPIGLETLKLAVTKPWAQIVGGIDFDPAKIGKDLSLLTRTQSLRGRKVYRSLDELVAHAKPEIILHSAVSRFKEAFAQIEPMARQGISVV